MTKLVDDPQSQALLDKIAGFETSGGELRTKQILRRLTQALFEVMDEYDVTEDEFWHALNFVGRGGPELGLWAAGLGIEHFIDLRLDAADRAEGRLKGTPRTIEGPLYVAGAPLEKGQARIDDGTDDGEVLLMHGLVKDVSGKPIPGAIVEVWHANTLGNYSVFDTTQSAFNLRRSIEVDAEGRYALRSIMPSGYAVPAGGTTEALMAAVGRHGRRPAHIHFFVTAPGHRHLTSQINIDGDPDLFDDFAFATREGLIPPVVRHETGASILGIEAPYAEIAFDFELVAATSVEEIHASSRKRA